METQLEHLSYSSISAYLSCGESWRRKYIAKEPTFTTPALVFGTAMHATVEQFVKHEETPAWIGKEPPLAAIWHTEWRHATEGKEIMWGADEPAEHENTGVRILTNQDVINGLMSLTPKRDDAGFWIEKKVELHVPGVPIPIIGYIDVVTADGVPGDFKTASKSWTQDKAQNEIQSLFYLAALNQSGIATPDWKFRHYTIVKTKAPKFEAFEHQHKPGELMFLFDLIQRVWTGIERGVFALNPTGWICSPTYCDFYSKCRGKYN